MADDVFAGHFPRLEDLCVKVVGASGSRWKPEQFLEIPRHLICPILEKFHPFDMERLEVSGVFQTLGIDTDPLWKVFYFGTWRRKSKWPEIYFKTKGISKGGEAWRVCYLQRRLQDALNSCHVPSKETSSSSAEGGQNIKNLVSICGRYVGYLRLYNSACIFLAENLDIWLQLAEYLEFLEVFILRDNGVNPLCHLLQVLTSKRLKSLGFCFCKVSSVQMWNRIINSLSKPSHQKNATDIHKEEKNIIISSTQKTTYDIFTSKGITKQTCDQLNCEQDIKSRSKETQGVQSDEISDDHMFVSTENGICDSLDGTDDVDIYEFMDSTSALSDAQENSCTCISNTHTRQSDGCVVQSLDIYDEVFGHCKCGQKAEAPKELSPLILNKQQKGNESSLQGRVSPGTSKLELPLPSFSNLSCSLVHFELVAFWLHHDLLALFVHALQGWLSLETLILEDNALGLVSTPGCEFIETLFFLCTKGRLQSLQLTNNPVNNEFAKLFFEKLIAAFCHKCGHSNNARSLTKLKFSSYQVSQVALAYLGRAIRDVCTCNQSAAELLESASSRSSSKEQTQAGCSEQKCSCVGQGHCVICETDHVFGSRKTNSAKMKKNSFDQLLCDTQEPQVRTKVNAKRHLCILDQEQVLVESREDSSEDKKPLPFVINNSNSTMFAGIQVLKLRCVVGDEGARFIAGGLRRNSSLCSLSLANCNINPAGLADIFQAVSGNRYLKQLCVKGNRYDRGNNDSLAKMLTSNNTLTDLDLGTCDLRGLSEKMIHALCINNTLTSLKLSRNGLGDADISALSQVFSHPSRRSKLSKLDLSFNHISPESLSVLASSLQSIRPRKLDKLKLTKKSVLSPEFHQVLSSLKSVVRNVTAEYLDHATLFADFISQM